MSGTWGMIGGTLVGQGSDADPLTVAYVMSTPVTVAAHATAHTKGAWTELVASAQATTTGLYLDVSGVGASTVDTSTLIDLATGAGGAESAVVSNIPVGAASAATGTMLRIFLPLTVAVGARISARIQSLVAGGKAASVAVHLITGGAHPHAATLDTLGASAGASTGTAVGTSWTQVVASAPATYRGLVPVPSDSSATMSTATGPLEIGSGNPGSELVIGSTLPVSTTSSENCFGASLCVAGGVAAGTRIALRRPAGACYGAVIGVQ